MSECQPPVTNDEIERRRNLIIKVASRVAEVNPNTQVYVSDNYYQSLFVDTSTNKRTGFVGLNSLNSAAEAYMNGHRDYDAADFFPRLMAVGTQFYLLNPNLYKKVEKTLPNF